jgi:hypothetical protein
MRKLPTKKMKKFPVCIPVELHTAFKTKCAAEGVMMTEVVRRLLERECEAKAKPARRSAKLEEMAA